jgi:hypothetical protein
VRKDVCALKKTSTWQQTPVYRLARDCEICSILISLKYGTKKQGSNVNDDTDNPHNAYEMSPMVSDKMVQPPIQQARKQKLVTS